MTGMTVSNTMSVVPPENTTFMYPKQQSQWEVCNESDWRPGEWAASYPVAVDDVCAKIVHALEKKNWASRGMEVEFTDATITIKGMAQNFRKVAAIRGDNFRLDFYDQQGKMGDTEFNDTSAVASIVINQLKLDIGRTASFYHRLNMYVGDNWERDKKAFRDEISPKPKEDVQRYTARKDPQAADSWYTQCPKPYLVATDNSLYYRTDGVFQRVIGWLTENVLQTIKSDSK